MQVLERDEQMGSNQKGWGGRKGGGLSELGTSDCSSCWKEANLSLALQSWA